MAASLLRTRPYQTPIPRCVRPGLLTATAGRLLRGGCYCSAAGVLLACVLEGSGFQVVRALTSSAQPSSSQRRNVCTNLQPPFTKIQVFDQLTLIIFHSLNQWPYGH